MIVLNDNPKIYFSQKSILLRLHYGEMRERDSVWEGEYNKLFYPIVCILELQMITKIVFSHLFIIFCLGSPNDQLLTIH